MTKVNRRKFIKAAGVTAAAGTTALAAPAIAQGIQEWKMVMSWPKGFPGLGTAAQNFANRLEVAMDGKVKVKLYGGGELVPALKCLDALQEGTADLYHSADYYHVGKSKAYAFFCSVPFGMTVAEADAWMHHGGGQKLWDELSAQFGVKPFLGGNTGVQMGGWFRKEMKTIEDFKGLKMRIPGLGGDVIRALGGTPVTLAGAEILPALQAGTVDAAEWVGPWNDLAFGLYKVAKYYYHPGFHEPSTANTIGIRKPLWDKMTKSQQAVFEAVAVSHNNIAYTDFIANNSAALDTLVTKHNVQLREFSDEIYKKAGSAAKDVLASVAKSDPFTQKVYDSYMGFRKKAVEWSRLGEQGYMQKRGLTKFS
ncbi:MAG: TRAP transporter substrate-binding protein [Hyphomicrobiaceae bacterium]